MNDLSIFYASLKNDLLLYARTKGCCLIPLLFFVLTCSLFPIVGMEKSLLTRIGPAILWIAALLSVLLSLNGLLEMDRETGRLEQMRLSPFPLILFMLARLIAHWCVTGVPLILCVPILAILFYIPVNAINALLVTLGLGTLVLEGIGGWLATLTLGLHQGGALLMLCVLPLIVPVLVLGVSAVTCAANGLAWSGPIAFLGALCIVVMVCAPWGMVIAVNIIEE
jgi:heme exporter protein B